MWLVASTVLVGSLVFIILFIVDYMIELIQKHVVDGLNRTSNSLIFIILFIVRLKHL